MQHLDIQQIYVEERERWFQREAPKRSFRDVISASVPYWIVIIAAVFYLLSAPHTAGILDQLTPGWGFVAPIGIEFGLLYASFRRRQSSDVPWMLWALEVLLFITAVLVNGAGAFTSVIALAGLDKLSFEAIRAQFGSLPATSQAALIMAVLAAFIIPIGALVAGEGLAKLMLEKDTDSDTREQRWRTVERKVIYQSIFVTLNRQGYEPQEAKARAADMVRGYFSHVEEQAPQLPAGQPKAVQANTTRGNKAAVQSYISEHPDAATWSINALRSAMARDGIQVSRTTVGDVLRATNKHQ